MAKEEIKFVKKKGEKGLKKIFNDQDGEDFMKNTLGVQKKSMKKGGQVTFNNSEALSRGPATDRSEIRSQSAFDWSTPMIIFREIIQKDK